MCLASKDGKYELLIVDKENFPLLNIDFCSITALCKVLEDINTERCTPKVYRKYDCQELSIDLILDIWRSK